MNKILDLTRNLSGASLRNIGNAMRTQNGKAPTETLLYQLFRWVMKHGNKPDSFYSEKLYGKGQEKNLGLLKHRVRRRIIEAVNNENNILRNNKLDKIDKE